jgi:hypothetical protein
VHSDAGIARPRRTDLFAYTERHQYLVEVKARGTKANISDLDGLRARLDRCPSGVVGVLVSLAGFTQPAVQAVAEHRSQPILLLGRHELESLAEDVEDMRALLDRKLSALTRDGKVDLAREPIDQIRRYPGARPEDMFLAELDGQRLDWFTSGGDFGVFTFVQAVTDPTWGPGPETSTMVHMPVHVGSQTRILEILAGLDEAGWSSNMGRWCIQQSNVNWHGAGTRTLRGALERWDERYAGCEGLHYREEVCYADSFNDGFYTLTFDVAADATRQIWYTDVSVELAGIPLDRQPLQALAEILGVREPLYLRVRDHPVLERCSLRELDLNPIAPTAYVVAEDERADGAHYSVMGVVLANPWRNVALPVELPRQLQDSHYLICDLADWHPLVDKLSAYKVVSAEWGWTSAGAVIRVRADWADEEYERKLDKRYANGPRRDDAADSFPLE